MDGNIMLTAWKMKSMKEISEMSLAIKIVMG
jgi:hypothetical protein